MKLLAKVLLSVSLLASAATASAFTVNPTRPPACPALPAWQFNRQAVAALHFAIAPYTETSYVWYRNKMNAAGCFVGANSVYNKQSVWTGQVLVDFVNGVGLNTFNSGYNTYCFTQRASVGAAVNQISLRVANPTPGRYAQGVRDLARMNDRPDYNNTDALRDSVRFLKIFVNEEMRGNGCHLSETTPFNFVLTKYPTGVALPPN